MTTKYAKVPIEAINDKRLSPTEFKVLVTLLSFADSSNKAWPKREAISNRCGIAKPHISRATAALVEYGWLQKVGNGGRSRSCQYQIKAPFTCAESVRVCGKTRTDSDTKTRTDSDTKTRTDSVRRKEQTNEQTIEQVTTKRLQQMERTLDRLPYQPEQANPILAAMADELGVSMRAGQTTNDLAQQLRREITDLMAGLEPERRVQ